MTQNGTAGALLIDYKVIFFFSKEKFCKNFSLKAKCGNKLAGMIKKILFESNLYDYCNATGTVPFEWLFDCAFTAIKAQRKNGAETEREELYHVFSKTWNECLVKEKRMTRGILRNIKAPIALMATVNPVHCDKIRESDFVKKHCRVSFLHSPTQHEEYNFLSATIEKLAEKAGVLPKQFVYMGNDLPQTVADDIGIKMIRYHRKIPARIIRAQLAHHGLI